MRETAYRLKLIDKLQDMFPGCFIIKNKPQDNQGIPDLLILFEDKWAMLEVKASRSSSKRPNQPYYVDKFNNMSHASFIHPQNEEQVLHDLQLALGSSR